MRPRCILFLFFLLIFAAGVQMVLADSAPNQPLFGFAWPSHNIPVLIESSQPKATRVVLSAITTWNLAQQWFITTYMAGAGTPFLFYETNSTLDSMITITFNQTQTVEDFGETHWQAFHDKQGFFQRVTVSISIDLTRQDGEILSDSALQTLATHELGHALGLDHTWFSSTDLMYHVPQALFPSTLNLYALYLLSQSSNMNNLPQQAVTLPVNIPYVMVSQAELSNVLLPAAIQTTITSSFGVTQVVSTIYGPWPYIGILVIVAGVAIALAVRGRRGVSNEMRVEEAKVIFHERPQSEETLARPGVVKKVCSYCGAEVPRDALICGKCGMPALFRK